MKIFYDTESDQFFTLTKTLLEPGNVKLYAPFVLPLDKGLWTVNATVPCLVFELESIPMSRASITVSGTEHPVIKPAFLRGAGRVIETQVAVDLTFLPEAGQRLFIIINLDNAITTLLTVAEIGGTLKFYQAGVPNVFTDTGNLCVGEADVPDPSTIARDGLYRWVALWKEAWTSAPFNADLLRAHHLETLKFNPETRTSIPIGENWPNIYPLIPTPDAHAVEAVKGVLSYAKPQS
jgi:hypothetical protein